MKQNNPFAHLVEVDQHAKDAQTNDAPSYIKMSVKDMPNFIGTFTGIKTINFDGSSFEKMTFVDVQNADTHEMVTKEGQEMHINKNAMLVRKTAQKVGKRVAVAYLGSEPMKENPAKTIAKFAVYDVPQNYVIASDATQDEPTPSQPQIDDNLPF